MARKELNSLLDGTFGDSFVEVIFLLRETSVPKELAFEVLTVLEIDYDLYNKPLTLLGDVPFLVSAWQLGADAFHTNKIDYDDESGIFIRR